MLIIPEITRRVCTSSPAIPGNPLVFSNPTAPLSDPEDEKTGIT